MNPAPTGLTELLARWKAGDRKGLEAIFPLVYDELRNLARSRLRRQGSNRALQTTELVHEAYVRLAVQKSVAVESRAHFFSLAARVMRFVLVDMERSRQSAKRGAGLTIVHWDAAAKKLPSAEVDVLALDEALERLAKMDAQQSEIVELRYFGGLSIEDTSEFLGLSPATVKRSWASARAWLLREISQGERAHGRRALAADQANS